MNQQQIRNAGPPEFTGVPIASHARTNLSRDCTTKDWRLSSDSALPHTYFPVRSEWSRRFPWCFFGSDYIRTWNGVIERPLAPLRLTRFVERRVSPNRFLPCARDRLYSLPFFASGSGPVLVFAAGVLAFPSSGVDAFDWLPAVSSSDLSLRLPFSASEL